MSINQYTPDHKTKIICTIGPASDSTEMLEKLMRSGMNIARLNFSHGDFDYHRNLIRRIREVSASSGRHIAIMGDLCGPKMRIGELDEPFTLQNYRSQTTNAEYHKSRPSIKHQFSLSNSRHSLPAGKLKCILNTGYVR